MVSIAKGFPHVGGTVWILGAGFSRALGGPLIADLLANRDMQILTELFSQSYARHNELVNDNLRARALFLWGHKQGYWGDAEQFLDIIETASARSASGPSHRSFLVEAILKGAAWWPNAPTIANKFNSLDSLALACRRALATDCSIFLRGADVETERWDPYVSWARSQLDWRHTVITFNFDAVPEILQTSEGRLSVVDPTNVKTSIKAAHDQDKAPVLKLHGSLTWSTNVGGDGFEMTNQPETALEYLGTREVVIGLPGPKKRGLYAKTLNELREAAEQALLVAGQVIFVGYRFPPTDADARRFLLEAIRNNRTDGGHIMMALVVLGPDTESPDAKRLRHLLGTVLGERFDVDVLPLFAEDFLSVRRIIQPRHLPLQA